MATGKLNPQLAGGSDCETLAFSAITRIGEYAPEVVDGDTLLLFMQFANRVVDEVNKHIYRRDLPDIEYYVALSDVRDIHDNIVITGMEYYYCMGQGDKQTDMKRIDFMNVMGSELWHAINGKKKVRMLPPDGGSETYSTSKRISDSEYYKGRISTS